MRGNPKAPGGASTGQEKPATATVQPQRTEMAALRAQLEQQKVLIESMRETMQGNGLAAPAAPAAPLPSQKEQEENTLRWATRRVEATKKLKHWQAKWEDAREKQRIANRVVDDAVNHIRHFEKKLKAIDETVSEEEWDQIQFVNTDWSHDSLPGDPQDAESMSVAEESTSFLDMSGSTDTAGTLTPQQPSPWKRHKVMTSNSFGPLADAETNPQPFAATQNTAFKHVDGAGQQADGLEAEAARIKLIRDEGARHNIQGWFLDSAISAGVTWQTLVDQLAIGHRAAHFVAAGNVPTQEDLAKLTPVSKQAAEVALKGMQQQLAEAQPPAIPPPPQENDSNGAETNADAEI